MGSHCFRWTERGRRAARSRLLTGCALSVLLITSGTLSGAADRAASEQRLEVLKRQIVDLRQGLVSDKKSYDALQKLLAEVEKRLAGIARARDDLRQGLRQQRRNLARLGLQRQALDERLLAQRQSLRRQFKARFLISRQGGPLRLILDDSGSIPRGRLMVYYDYIQRQISDQLMAARQTRDRLAVVEDELRDSQARLQSLLDEQERMLSEEQQRKAERTRLLAQLDAAIASKQASLAQALDDQRRLQALLDGLQQGERHRRPDKPSAKPAPARREDAPVLAFASQKAALPWPLHGKVVAHFGRRRTKMGLRWRGVMIASEPGKAVQAVYAGKVIFADWFRGFGLLIIIDHGEGYMTLYGHNQRLEKRDGEQVAQGETIAHVGSTGGLSRSALYFEVRHHGRPEDPLRWFTRRG